MHPSTLAKRGPVLLFLAVVAFYFYGLGHLPFVGPDEPRYAQVAREMLLRQDLVTPTLGGHPWFEKPALLYWMMILSFKLFGVSEWAARLPAAVSGLLTVAAVFLIGKRLEANSTEEPFRDDDSGSFAGFWSTLAAVTTIGLIIFSRAASFDILLTMTTAWALAFYILYALEEGEAKSAKANNKRGRALLAGFYIFIGLSLLAKGLVGIVIPVGVVGLYYLLQRRLPERKAIISLSWGLPLALIVAAMWYAPVIWRHGWAFIDPFFIQHHFARYVSDKYHHWRPAYYYLLAIPLLAAPWTAFLVEGLVKAVERLRRAKIRTVDHWDNRPGRILIFALAWFLFPLLFFSFANSKLPGYILPVLPAVALLVGERMRGLSSDSSSGRWPIRITAAFCVLLATAAFVYYWRTGNLTALQVVLFAVPPFIAGGFALLSPRRTRMAVSLIAGATLAVMIVLLRCAAPAFAELESSKRLLEIADARGYSQSYIYGMQRSDRTPEFYAAGRVIYDADGEPIMYEGPTSVIDESRRRNETVLVFVRVGEVSQLTGLASVQTEVIGNNGRYAIVAVRAGSAGILPAARGAASPE